MSDSEDDSILDNIQKTRELWSTKADVKDVNYLIPKSPISPPLKQMKSPQPVENGMNGNHEEIIRFEDQVQDDFDLPDVKSMKSQWEKPGPALVPVPSQNRQTRHVHHEPDNVPVPVNREMEETKEEYKVELGSLREKFEKEAKAQNARVVWDDGPRSPVSKAAVDQRVNMKKKHTPSTNKPRSTAKQTNNKRFETEIKQQQEYQANKDTPVEMPKVELSSIKQQFENRKDECMVVPHTPSRRKARETSFSSDTSAQSTEVVRPGDQAEEEINYDIELSSIRKKFEQGSKAPLLKSKSTTTIYLQPSTPTKQTERRRTTSQNEDAPTPTEVEIVKSSEAKYDQMTGEESVKDKLARFKAMTEKSKKSKPSEKFTYQKKTVVETTVVIKKQEEEQKTPSGEVEIVRSLPAGTKEKAEYTPSVDLEQTKQLFEQSSRSGRSSRSSRSSDSSSRRSPRSHSTPSPVKRGFSTVSSKSPSPNRRNSGSSSSGRGSPLPVARKSTKRVGDPDVVVLEHTEVNYYYEEGRRLSTKVKTVSESERENAEMSNGEVIRPEPAGTKEAPEFVPSVNIRSVRDMFEHPAEQPVRGRTPPKKQVIIEREQKRDSSSDSNSPERNPEIVRSTAAGSRETPKYEISLDLKAARSKFESPQRPDNYVPRNNIRQREEEARQRRAAAAAAAGSSERSSESSDASYEVVKTAEAGAKEKPDYHVDLKATKQMFEHGGTAPLPNSIKKTFEDDKNVSATYDENERKDPIDIQQESRMVIQKEQEVKEESTKIAAEVKSSSDSESDRTASEGEVILEQSSEDNQEEQKTEVLAQTTEEKEASSSESETNEEPVVVESVDVVKPEDIHQPEETQLHQEEVNQVEQNSEQEPEPVVQEYDTYSKVIDYNEDHPQQAPSSSESEEEVEKVEVSKQNHKEEQEERNVQSVNGRDYIEENEALDSQNDVQVSNHIPEQKSMGEGENSPQSPPSPLYQDKEGFTNEADEGTYLH